MRKLFWCGAAGLVACAAAVYAVADHAAKHPDSYLGRCIGSAASVGMRGNPFVAMNPLVTNPVLKGCTYQVSAVAGYGAVAQAAFCTGQQHCAQAAKPEADAFVEQEEPDLPHDSLPVEDVQPFEPIKVEQMPDEPIKVEEHNWIIDDALGIIDAPLGHGRDDVGYGGLVPETEEPRTGGVEESEPPVEGEVPPMPYIEEEDEGTGVCPVDENGCNKWLWKLLEMGGIVRETTIDDAEEIPMPTPCDDEETQDQGSENPATPDGQEPTNDTQTPSSGCQEDPAYHHHYHGCPYMGGCPYPYSRPVPSVLPSEEQQEPQQPQSEEGAAKKKIKYKKKPCAESGCLKSFWFKTEGYTGQCGVDTMEFRPSDDTRESPGNAPF